MTVIMYRRKKDGTRKALRVSTAPRAWIEFISFEDATQAAAAFDGVQP